MSKLSKFLKTNGLNALSKAAQGNPIGAITSLFGLTGENTEVGILNALKSNSEALSILKEKELEYVRVITDDRNSARNMNIKLNKQNSNWLSRNTVSILAIFWTVASIFFYYLQLTNNYPNGDILKDINYIVILVFTFYFGSSLKK